MLSMQCMPESLKTERENLLKAIDGIRSRITTRKLKNNPYYLCDSIKKNILELNNNPQNSKTCKERIGMSIRHFHDFYGWKSKDNENNFGLCSGSFYRTLGFIDIDPKTRSGKQSDKKTDFGVHIEHTIPVNVIRAILIKNVDETTSLQEIFEMILDYSVCTGVSRKDENEIINNGHARSHPQIMDGNPLPHEEIKPFSRYKDGTIIYSILSGGTVPLDSNLKSINDHRSEYDIFKWEFINYNYGKPLSQETSI